MVQKIILNGLKPQVEKIIPEELAGFRAGSSTVEHIFKVRILCEKYLYHHATLWATMKQYNKGTDLV